jgi:hypothetical protein
MKPTPQKDPLPLRRRQPSPQPPPLQMRMFTVTQDDQATLDRLSKDLRDYSGRAVSASAVLRALVRFAGRQPYQWGLTELSPLIEQEMGAGVLWGKKKEGTKGESAP